MKVGDVVRLKGGGPQMTVIELFTIVLQGKEHWKAECAWFLHGECKRESFLVKALNKVDEEGEG